MLATVQVAFCSGIYLDRKASWSKALENLFLSPLLGAGVRRTLPGVYQQCNMYHISVSMQKIPRVFTL